MIIDIFESLIYNAALLLSTLIVYDIIVTRQFDKQKMVKIFTGIIIGVISLAIMMHPWQLQPGIVVDTRTILFSIAALFFGAIPAIIGGLIAIAYRIWLGGGGVYVGVSTIINSIIWGLLWRNWHKRRECAYSLMGFYQLGLITHLTMIILMFLLPSEVKWQMIHAVSIPILLIYPLVTVLMGQILMRRAQRVQERQALEKSEYEYRLLAETTQDMIVLHDIEGNISYTNKVAKDFFGIGLMQGDHKKIREFILPEYIPMLESYAKQRREGLLESRIYQMQVWGAQEQIKLVEINSNILSGEGENIQMLAAMRDITERMRTEEQRKRYAIRLEILQELDSIVLKSLPFKQVCDAAMEKLQALIPFKVLMLAAIKGKTIQILALHKPELRHRYLNTKDHFPYNTKLSSKFLKNQNYVIPDASLLSEEKNMPIRAALIKEGMQSFMYNAMIRENELVGFLWFCSNKKDAFGPEQIEEGEVFANQLAIVLSQLELAKQVKDHAQDMETQVNLLSNQLKEALVKLETCSDPVAHDLQASSDTNHERAEE